jgi:large conductance mechanosensitive channel
MRKTLGEFKEFLLRGNVVDLAIAVVIGAAFTGIVTAIVSGLITPLIGLVIAAAVGDYNLPTAVWEVSGTKFAYGAVIDKTLTFVITAAVVFFAVLKPVNHLLARRKTEPEVGSTTKECPECLSSIPDAARRCAFCTSEVPATV